MRRHYWLAVMLLGNTLVHAQTADKERIAMLAGVCQACHGENGVSTSPDLPSLAGQNEPYLFETLKTLKSEHSASVVMQGITRDIPEEDLRLLANYFAALPYVRNPQPADPARAKRGQEVYERLCQLCHLDSGRSTTYGEFPLLAGQTLNYMIKEVDLIINGKRDADIMKRGMLGLVSREQIEDAIHFFASQQVSPDQVKNTVVQPDKRSRRNRFKNAQQ